MHASIAGAVASQLAVGSGGAAAAGARARQWFWFNRRNMCDAAVPSRAEPRFQEIDTPIERGRGEYPGEQTTRELTF